MRKVSSILLVFLLAISLVTTAVPVSVAEESEEVFAKQFAWWPTDASPGPVKDLDRGGFWWWPQVPGAARPWGNRGYIYVRKVIFDYKDEPSTSQTQLKPSLVLKKIHKNIKIYFDFDKSELRDDAIKVLGSALRNLNKHPETDILITGNADTRGSEEHNFKLAEARASAVKFFMLENDIEESRIRIVSRGKLDAIAPVTDLAGMARDRNAQFMIAEVVEVLIPESQRQFYEPVTEEGETTEGAPILVSEDVDVEDIEAEITAAFREYTIQEGDTLSKLAKEVYDSAMKWEYIYNFNKDVIDDPHKLKVGQVINIPEE